MKKVIQLEELAMLIMGIYAFTSLSYPWWLFLVVFLVPDIGMAGYLLNSKVGAFSYNIFHHKGLAILIYFLGLYLKHEMLQLSGIIVFSHAAFDRSMGYGLKYAKGFKFTHLGTLGKEK